MCKHVAGVLYGVGVGIELAGPSAAAKPALSRIRSRSLGGSFYQAGVTFTDEVVEKRGKQFCLFDQLRDFLLGRDLCS